MKENNKGADGVGCKQKQHRGKATEETRSLGPVGKAVQVLSVRAKATLGTKAGWCIAGQKQTGAWGGKARTEPGGSLWRKKNLWPAGKGAKFFFAGGASPGTKAAGCSTAADGRRMAASGRNPMAKKFKAHAKCGELCTGFTKK